MTAFLILFGAFTAIYPDIQGVYMTPKMVCIASGASWGLWAAPPSLEPPLRRGFLLVIICALLSSVLSDSPIYSLAGHANGFSGGFVGILLTWLCYEAAWAQGPGKDSERFVAAGAALTALAALSQVALGWPAVGPLPGGRAYGLIGSPPFLGCMLALAAPVVWRRGWMLHMLLAAGVAFAQSRAGFIGYVAACAVYLLGPQRAVAGAAVALILGLAFGPQRLGGDDMRIQTWATAARVIEARPWLGWGIDGFADAFMRLRDPLRWGYRSLYGVESAHMFFLDAATAGGLLGLASVGFLGYQAARRPAPRALLGALAGVMAYGFFNPIPFPAFCVLAYLWGEHDASNP